MTPYQILATLVALSGGANPLEEDPGFQKAKEVYDQRAVLANHEKAAEGFASLARRFPESLEAQLWCARTNYYVAHRLREDKLRMRRMAALGHECGDRLMGRFGESYDAQIWALLARFRKVSASSMIPPLGEIERLAQQLEALRARAPKEHVAYMILGAMYRELPGWPLSIGDHRKSLALLIEGERLAPDNAEVLLQLADTYRAMGETEKARSTYRRCAERGVGPPELEWESRDAREWAKKMLAELE